MAYEKGTTIRFEIDTTDKDGNLVDPDQSGSQYQVSIKIANASTDNVEISETNISDKRDSEGEFHYHWQTSTSLTEGQYEVTVKSTITGDEILNTDFVKLVDVK